MNRHKMLMGEKKEEKTPKITHRKSIRKDRRTLSLSDLGLDGADIETIATNLRNLQVSEKAKGHFTINLTVVNDGGEDYDDIGIDVYTERYETVAEVEERIKKEKKKEEAKKKKQELMKTPQYQKSLIDRMNRNVATAMRY